MQLAMLRAFNLNLATCIRRAHQPYFRAFSTTHTLRLAKMASSDDQEAKERQVYATIGEDGFKRLCDAFYRWVRLSGSIVIVEVSGA